VEPAVASPCTNVCRIDDAGLCAGCGRTLGEIAEWSEATPGRKREILARIESRRRYSVSRRA